jgi:hypothetical protein
MNTLFVKVLAPIALLGTLAAAPVMAKQPPVHAYQRLGHQERRIAQGIRTGELTPRETGRLETREVRMDRQVTRDRAINGGYLTQGERFRVRHELNGTSREIYRFKHNDQKV